MHILCSNTKFKEKSVNILKFSKYVGANNNLITLNLF